MSDKPQKTTPKDSSKSPVHSSDDLILPDSQDLSDDVAAFYSSETVVASSLAILKQAEEQGGGQTIPSPTGIPLDVLMQAAAPKSSPNPSAESGPKTFTGDDDLSDQLLRAAKQRPTHLPLTTADIEEEDSENYGATEIGTFEPTAIANIEALKAAAAQGPDLDTLSTLPTTSPTPAAANIDDSDEDGNTFFQPQGSQQNLPAVEEDFGERTAFEQVDLRAIRDQALRLRDAAKKNAPRRPPTPAAPIHATEAEPTDFNIQTNDATEAVMEAVSMDDLNAIQAQQSEDMYSTMVDPNLNYEKIEETLRKRGTPIKPVKKSTPPPPSYEPPPAPPIQKAQSKSTSTTHSHRTCFCDHVHTDRAITTLTRQPTATGGRALFVLLGFLTALGGSFGFFWFGMARLHDFQSILGLSATGVGLGLVAGAWLSLRASDERRNRLLVETSLLMLLCFGLLAGFFFVTQMRLLQHIPQGLVLKAPWGPPFLRESLLWTTCLGIGLIGGWSFRLKPLAGGSSQGLPTYTEILSEYIDPDLERAGRSYNDVLLRSKQELKLIPVQKAQRTVKATHSCFYCYRNADALLKESEGSEWLAWMLQCPHCNESLCLQHYAENAWQCRSCGKPIRNRIHLCVDCKPGQLPDGQRAVLCPHCHLWKGCPDHYKARGWACPHCNHNVRGFVEAYGYRDAN